MGMFERSSLYDGCTLIPVIEMPISRSIL